MTCEEKKINLLGEPDDDLRCPICLDWLFSPSTTPCGHTFCGGCLFESLLIKKNCPLCRQYLDVNSMSSTNKNVDKKLSEILSQKVMYISVLYISRKLTFTSTKLEKEKYVVSIPANSKVEDLFDIFLSKGKKYPFCLVSLVDTTPPSQQVVNAVVDKQDYQILKCRVENKKQETFTMTGEEKFGNQRLCIIELSEDFVDKNTHIIDYKNLSFIHSSEDIIPIKIDSEKTNKDIEDFVEKKVGHKGHLYEYNYSTRNKIFLEGNKKHKFYTVMDSRNNFLCCIFE